MYDFFKSENVTAKKNAVVNQVLNGILNDEISVDMLLNDLINTVLIESREFDIIEIKRNL